MTPPECLQLLRPGPAETDLLRSCLWSGESARAAWTRWQDAAGDARDGIERDFTGVKSLLPMLHEGLRRSGAETPAVAQAMIRTAALAEQVRWERYGAVCERAFAALADRRVPFLVLKGAALSVTAYPKPFLRHSHDIDLLLHPHDLPTAAELLGRVGFTATAPRRRTAPDSVMLLDSSRLPVELHARLYRLPHYGPPPESVWQRAVPQTFGPTTFATLSRADHLVYVCGQAACCASRDSLKWAVDAFQLIGDGTGLDWTAVGAAVHESRLAVPLAVILSFLARDLGAPVPVAVLEEIADAAARASRADVEVALTGLRAGRAGTFRNLFRAAPSWRERLVLLRWMVLPSAAALRGGEPLRFSRLWPLAYVTRPLGYLARRAARF